MSEQYPQQNTAEMASTQPIIPYEPAAPTGRRRWWTYAIVAGYLLLVGGLLTIPLWAFETADIEFSIITGLAILLLILCGLALILTPVRIARRRPITRRTILTPIISSGLLLGGLVLGGGIALAELFAPETRSDFSITTANGQPSTGAGQTEHTPSNQILEGVTAGAMAVWIAWSIFFILIARSRDPAGVGMKLHRYVIAGSVLELLIAVPAHIIVRRRSDCCAGWLTGTGICIGAVIALIAFGPTVLLLFYKRCRQIAVPVLPITTTPADRE